MSLSRILNDDPAPGPSTRPARPVSPPFSSNLHVTQPDIPPSPHHASQHRIVYPDARPSSPHSISTGRVERLRSPSLSVRDTPSHPGLRGQQDPALYQQYPPPPVLDEQHYRSSKRRRNEDEELQSPGYKRVRSICSIYALLWLTLRNRYINLPRRVCTNRRPLFTEIPR